MSNERTANGGRLTRAMHRAAAAIYAAGFEREREEPVVEHFQGGPPYHCSECEQRAIGNSEALQDERICSSSNEVVSDISPMRCDEGGSTSEAPSVQDIGDQGIPDSSGETQR